MGKKATFFFLLMVSGRAAHTQAAERAKLFSASFHDSSPLQILLRWGGKERLPVGVVVFGSKLCDHRVSLNLNNVPVTELMSVVLKDTHYGWSIKDGVIEVKPHELPLPDAKLLNLEIPQFSSIDTTMQGVGVQLRGEIGARLRHGTGYALDVLSSPTAEKVPPLKLNGRTVETTLNTIVAQGSKGLWILHARPEKEQESRATEGIPIDVYGYQDDQQALSQVTCQSK